MHTTKKRFGSKAFPRPMSGPHLKTNIGQNCNDRHWQGLPVLDIGTTSKRMTNDHYIVSGFVKRSPGLVSDGYVSEYDTAV
jgi:hypothetical protein